uniref:Uncharacterized protein n=1 Tax=Fagus sylvatica TaxID=28930 RepID=A0A2N9FH79_FAGSY
MGGIGISPKTPTTNSNCASSSHRKPQPPHCPTQTANHDLITSLPTNQQPTQPQPQKHDLVTAPGQIGHHRRRPPSRGLGNKVEENMRERKEKEFLDREQRIKKSKQKFYKSYSTR